ncbi:MAG: hypothetical protein WCR12_06625 [Dysgonamonadaceae bacterium]
MRKYLYLSALLGIIFLGCEEINLDINPNKPETEEIKVVKQYVSGTELDLYRHYSIGTDTTLIYVYGSKDNKLFVKGFNKENKQNFWTWTSKTEVNTSNNLPINKINDVIIDQVYKDQNDYFILMYNIGTNSDIYQKLLFVSNGNEVFKEFNLTDFSNQLTFGKNITSWYEDSFLINTYIDFGNNQGVEVLRCYDFEGEVLFDTAKPKNIGSYSSNSYLPLSTEESLFLEKNILKRHNLRTDSILWESSKIESIPDNAIINNVNFEVINSEYTRCTINITLIGGEKKTVSIKISNATGDYQNM